MGVFRFVRPAGGRDIKDSQPAPDECPCHGVDQYRDYLDARRAAFDDKKRQEVCRMKLLVYGAGVIGCELAHVLKKGGNDVTLLARGEWKGNLEKRGLVIWHYLQRKTTTDKVNVTGSLDPDDEYDIIFVVMQADQVPEILPMVAANVSRYVVFVGNNPWAEKTETEAQSGSPVKKEAAFGFMGYPSDFNREKPSAVASTIALLWVFDAFGRLHPTAYDTYPIGRISAIWHFSHASIRFSHVRLHPEPENAFDIRSRKA